MKPQTGKTDYIHHGVPTPEEFIESKIMTVAGQVREINLPEILKEYASIREADKAQAFAEWVNKEFWEPAKSGWIKFDDQPITKTTSELYREFLKQ